MAAERPPQPDQVARGIAIILASTAAMAFADAMVKRVSADLTLWQVFVTRSAFAVPCLLVLARWQGARLRPVALPWTVLRGVLLVLTWLAFYASLPVLSLSVAAVAVYTNPVVTALLSARLLGERVSRRQWLGVLLGFAGVATILRPGSDAFSWAVLLPLAAAVLYSAAMVLTRSKCRGEGAVTLALGLHLSFIVAGAAAVAVLSGVALSGVALAGAALTPDTVAAYPFLLATWPAMAAADWGLMAFLGVLSAAFFLGVARAYQIAPPQVIATFDYGYLVWAAVWGMAFFAEVPDGPTLLGMVLITAAGLLVARPARAAAPPAS